MSQHRSNVGPTLDCQRLTVYQRCDSMPTLGQRCHAIWAVTVHVGLCQTWSETPKTSFIMSVAKITCALAFAVHRLCMCISIFRLKQSSNETLVSRMQ